MIFRGWTLLFPNKSSSSLPMLFGNFCSWRMSKTECMLLKQCFKDNHDIFGLIFNWVSYILVVSMLTLHLSNYFRRSKCHSKLWSLRDYVFRVSPCSKWNGGRINGWVIFVNKYLPITTEPSKPLNDSIPTLLQEQTWRAFFMFPSRTRTDPHPGVSHKCSASLSFRIQLM